MEGSNNWAMFRGSPKFLDALVDDFSEKLKSFLGEKVVSVFGVRDEFNKLQDKMKYIKSMLTDAKRMKMDDSVTRTWIDELIDVMHDADDIIDDFRSQFEKQSEDGASSWSLNQLASKLNPRTWYFAIKSCFMINDRIIELNKKIDEINKNKQTFSVGMNQIQSSKYSRQTSSIIDPDVVGQEIEHNTRKLIEIITRNHDRRKLCTIAIIGMGGIGKTTLARNVFHDPLIRNTFQERIWVCVSKEYSAIEVLQSIIKKIKPNTGEAQTISELLEQLAFKIKGKRFFLVLDDLWQYIVWTDLLKNPLQFAAIGLILLTTRDKAVASGVGAIYVHEVGTLSRRSGWELLCKKAYIEEEDDMLNLRDVGMNIVKRCDGLPLAIKVIGGLLATKNKDRREWEKVLQSKTWFSSEISEELHGALWISFEDLTQPLRNCFIYCSLFAEDFYMCREDLVRQWIAEGIIQQKENEFLEDTGEEYYNELIRRCLLQPRILEREDKFLEDKGDEYHNELIRRRPLHSKTFLQFEYFEHQSQMHDIVRTFAQCISRGDNHYGNPASLSLDYVQKLHRLSIAQEGDVAIIPGNKSDPLRLRALILYWSPPTVQDDIYHRIKNVRVLLLNGLGIKNIPDSIGDLKHLRMLDLDHTSISTLPNSICYLIRLQILHLQRCQSLQVLPQGITQLSNLRCLGLEDTPLVSVPTGICSLKFLNELKGFVVAGEQYSGDMHSGWLLDELKPLTQLRCLKLDNLQNAAIQSSILAGKCYLKTLQMSCSLPSGVSGDLPSEDNCKNIEEIFEKLEPPQCLEYLVILRFFGRQLPSWLGNLTYLTWLILVNFISCHHLPPLGQLQHLRCLRVTGARSVVTIGPEFMGTVISERSNMTPCFPKLELLRIDEMPNWEEWSIDRVPQKIFPSLLKIELENCPKLKAIPEQLKHISSLEELIISGVQGMREIENLTSHFKWVYIGNSSCEKLSNVPRVQHLNLVNCSALRCVENLDALQSLYLEDESVDHLPEWLPDFLNQHHNNDDIKLYFVCSMEVLKRCLLGGLDWPIIEQFSHIHVITNDNTAFMEYQKQPYSYNTNL
ncbi:Disease resistance protein (CC-NBS-LRR class) family [Rhynchospora pubera]|uniref:Disease resistance protein (CC-NBS-LRR class) family n=1 Tax=Rhynchospora pubera TaxID=906938 RepID=A0AAV8GAN0_9POAL|nr:Disease resistance protein (CC-NBS-LRR class) family [Rhynchospora pubera]